VLTYFFSTVCVFGCFAPFHTELSGVRCGVPSVSKTDQPINRRGLVFWSEMGVPHDHLKCPVPEQFCNRPQIHPGHH
jgi:hypothetical protein